MMKKFFLIFLFLGISSLSQSVLCQTPQPTATPDDETETDIIKVSTTLIKVDVVVTDKKNKQVTDLKADDFEVYENGKKQEITSFSYVSPKSKIRPNNSSADNLGLQNDEDGLSLKDKISIPTRSENTDSNNIRRTLVLVVDNLGLNFKSIRLVKKSLEKFIKEQIREGDLVTIVTTGGASGLPSFTSDKKELLAIVKKLKWSPQSRGGADDYEPIRSTLLEEMSDDRGRDLPGVREEAALLENIDRAGQNKSAAGTLGALNYIVSGMRQLPGRKALILFSEGFSLSDLTSQNYSTSNINNSPIPNAPPAMNNSLSSGEANAVQLLIKTANQSSVVIYAIDPRGLQNLSMANADDDITKAMDRNFKPGLTGDKRTSRDDYFRQTQDGLRVLASETGGFAVLNQSDLDKGLEQIIDDQSYYLLSFITSAETVDSPKDVFDKVEIKVKEPDLQVRYRTAFYSPDSKIENPGAAKTPREQIGQALAFPFKANEIKLNLYSVMGNDAYGDFARFLINISAQDLKFEKDAKGSRTTNFDMLAITLDDDEKPINQFVQNFTITVNEPTYKNILKKGFVYVLPVVLKKSGIYHFRVAVRDSKTEKVGAAAKFLETPKFEKKRLWLSDLTLKSVSKNDAKTTEQENNDKRVFTDTTLRQFDSSITLNYSSVIYNAKTQENAAPDLTLQTRLIQDGKIVLETPPEPISTENQKDLQRIDLVGSIDLKENLTTGNYVFQIIVTDNLADKKTRIATQLIDFEIVK